MGGVSVLVLIILVSRRCRQHQRHRVRSSASHNSENSVKNIPRKTSRTNLSDDQASMLLPTNTVVIDLEIAPSSVQILHRIGNARYGTVYIGSVVTSSVASNPVIVKTLTGGADPLTREFFIARTRAMVGLKHSNVLGLVGACLQQTAQSGIISALYEHYDGVDLNTFLHRERSLSRSPRQSDVLMKLAVDSACGLTYLSQHSLTHGDVASNNILVVRDAGCAVTAKICDMGMASPWCSCSSQQHRIDCLSAPDLSVVWPQRPIAPELLLYGHVAITEATDVWQFGVVLYQIYYVIRHQHLVATATDCCSDESAQRPTFKDIHHRLLSSTVTFDPVNDPVNDPVIDRVTGEVIWGCDQHTSSPATSNETGYSLLTSIRQHEEDGLINQHRCQHQQPREMMMNEDHSTLPRSLSSQTSSHVV